MECQKCKQILHCPCKDKRCSWRKTKKESVEWLWADNGEFIKCPKCGKEMYIDGWTK